MSMNATQYNVVFPLAKKNEYQANDTVDFILSLENKKLVPGSLAITGECTLLKDVMTPVIMLVSVISLLNFARLV
jgi:hypothetical protein